jgi:hypothetical protein
MCLYACLVDRKETKRLLTLWDGAATSLSSVAQLIRAACVELHCRALSTFHAVVKLTARDKHNHESFQVPLLLNLPTSRYSSPRQPMPACCAAED